MTTGTNLITRNSGSTLNLVPSVFSLPTPVTSLTFAVGNSVVNGTGSILGGWATINGTDWATISSHTIAALSPSSYTNDTWGSGLNTTVTQPDSPSSGSTTNSLRFNAAPAVNTVTLAGLNTISSGGILVTPAVGNVTTIAGGSLTSGLSTAAGADLVVQQFNTYFPLTISSGIVNNGATAIGLTKAGPGILILSGGANDTYTGPTVVNGGTLRLGAANSIPSTSAVALTGGATLNLNGLSQNFKSVSLAGTSSLVLDGVNTSIVTLSGSLLGNIADNSNTSATVTIGDATNTSSTFSGMLFDRNSAVATTTTGTLSLVKNGSGALTLSPGFVTFAPGAANLYTGGTTINAGTLILNPILAPNELASTADTILGATPTAPVGNSLTLNSGTTLQANATMALSVNRGIAIGPTSGSGAATFDVTNGNTFSVGAITNNGGGTGGLIKTDNGILAIGASSTYAGPTTVNAGILQLAAANALPPATSVTLAANTMLDLNGPAVNATQYIGQLNGAGFVDSFGAANPSGSNTLFIGYGFSGTDTFSSLIQNSSSGLVALAKVGAGTFTLSTPSGTPVASTGGYFTYFGGTSIYDGTLTLDFSNATGNTSPTNLLNAGGTMTFAGGTFRINGPTAIGATTSQTFNVNNLASLNVTVSSAAGIGGATSIVVANNSTGGSTTLNLGAVVVNLGGTVDFAPVAGGGSATITLSNTNTNAILGPWATFGGGANWGVNNGSGAVAALTSYTNDTWAAGNNTTVTTSSSFVASVFNTVTTGTLRFNAAAANTISLTGPLTSVIAGGASGGILVTPSVGAFASTISGGLLTGGTSAATNSSLFVQQFDSSAALTISSSIVNAAPGITALTHFVKSGSGTLILSGANTYAGYTYINGGAVQLGPADALGIPAASSLVLNGSSSVLDLNGGNTSIAGLASGPGANNGATAAGTGGTITNNGSLAATLTLGTNNGVGIANPGTTWAFGGQINDGAKALSLVKVGAGTQILQGTDIISGPTTISNGTLLLDYTFANTQKISGAALNLGATLSLIPNDGGTTQTLGQSLNLLAGSGSTIASTPSYVPSVFTLTTGANPIARGNGSTLNFMPAANVTYAVGSGVTNTNGILGGWATVGGSSATNGTDWATVSGGAIVPLPAASYLPFATDGSTVANGNYLLNNKTNSNVTTTLASSESVFTLKLATTTGSNATLDLGTQTLTVATAAGGAIGGILWSGGGTLTIKDGTLAAGSSGELLLNANPTRTIALAADALLDPSVTTLTEAGGGTLILGGTGGSLTTVNVAAGIMQLGTAAGSGAASTNLPSGTNLSIGAAGTLELFGYSLSAAALQGNGNIDNNQASTVSLTVTGNSNTTFAGSITGNLTFTYSGTGTLTLVGPGSTFTGNTMINNASGGGTLAIQTATALGVATNTVTVGFGNELDLQGGVGGLINGLPYPITIAGPGVHGGALNNTSGFNTVAGPITMLGPTKIADAAGSILYFNTPTANTYITNNGNVLTFSGAGPITVTGGYIIGGNNPGNNNTGSLTYSGTSTLTLATANNYTGGTTINSGIVNINNDGTIVSGQGSLGAIPANAAVNITFAGNGTLQFANAMTLANTRDIKINPGVTATLDTESYPIIYNGIISDFPSGTLDVISSLGGGTLSLFGTNSYSGGTLIGNATSLGGTLSFNFDGAARRDPFHGHDQHHVRQLGHIAIRPELRRHDFHDAQHRSGHGRHRHARHQRQHDHRSRRADSQRLVHAD